MAEIKLFSLHEGVKECGSSEVLLEKEIQTLIEQNMETFFGVRFLKSEYAITNGRMDSIGIDENNSPVIFEYKRSQNENVINKGLFYLDLLLLEHLNTPAVKPIVETNVNDGNTKNSTQKTHVEKLAPVSDDLKSLSI